MWGVFMIGVVIYQAHFITRWAKIEVSAFLALVANANDLLFTLIAFNKKHQPLKIEPQRRTLHRALCTTGSALGASAGASWEVSILSGPSLGGFVCGAPPKLCPPSVALSGWLKILWKVQN